jgi:hypothetical protein
MTEYSSFPVFKPEISNMVFGEDEGKDSEAGKDSEIGYYEEIIKTSSVIPTCFLHNNGKDKGAKSVEKDENARVARLRSRRKAGEATSEKRRHKKSTKSPLEFTYTKLSFYFMLPLPFAARALEISHTSLKKLCRELGIVRWPYVRGGLERFGRLGAAQGGNARETQATSMPNADSAKSEESQVRNLARIAFSSFDSTPATPASAASTPASTPSRTSTARVRVHRGPSITHRSLEPPRLELDPPFRPSRHLLNDLSTDDLSWLLGNTTSRLREGDTALDLELVLGAHEEVLKCYT